MLFKTVGSYELGRIMIHANVVSVTWFFLFFRQELIAGRLNTGSLGDRVSNDKDCGAIWHRRLCHVL